MGERRRLYGLQGRAAVHFWALLIACGTPSTGTSATDTGASDEATIDPTTTGESTDATGTAIDPTITGESTDATDTAQTTDDATTSAPPPSCPARPNVTCVTPYACEGSTGIFGCGGCGGLFDVDGCVRATCEVDADCAAGETCRHIVLPFANLICEQEGDLCLCGGDPIGGSIDVCVPDSCG